MAKGSITFKDGGSVEAVLPKALYLSVVKIQADKEVGWNQACDTAAKLIDSGGAKFTKDVKDEARRLYNSELMKQMNAARETIKETIREKAWEEGADSARRNESNFQVPCPKCGKPMRFSDSDANWNNVNQVLREAFKGWSHKNC
jgi:hypothetical protein